MKIIYSVNAKKILRFISRDKRKSCFSILSDDLMGIGIFLKSRGMKELNISLSDDERILCEKEYLATIDKLSLEQNSLNWWANPISEKNEHIGTHYKNICRFYSFAKIVKRCADDDIFVVCGPMLLGQLKEYCHDNDIVFLSLEKGAILWAAALKRSLDNMLKICLSLGSSMANTIYASYMLRPRLANRIKGDNHYVIRTWLDQRFLAESKSYKDAYFGKLADHVVKRGYKPLVLAGVVSKYRDVVRKSLRDDSSLIVPEEYFLRLTDFLLLALYFIRTKIKRVTLDGVDLTFLYAQEINKRYFSPEYFRNILKYFIARRLAKMVDFKVYIQTYENYAWEKLSILGIREINQDAEIFGFQHAFVSRNSFKYFPGKNERDMMPAPDRVITMGLKTKEILENYGNYKTGVLRVGCALRQDYLADAKVISRRKLNRIMVPLTMVHNESVSILRFLADANINLDTEVLVRCHPAAPLDLFKKYIDFNIPHNFVFYNDEDAQTALSKIDMMFYTWTTLALEALKVGLPVIYLDILDPMYVDPLFMCSALKRVVKSSDQLTSVINNLYNMEDEPFYLEQKQAQEYLKDYFYPMTENNLDAFYPTAN